MRETINARRSVHRAWLNSAILFASAAIAPGHAASLVSDATLVGTDTLPVVHAFEIGEAGTYELKLSDVGFPSDLHSIQVAITAGNRIVARLAAPGTVQFDATAGPHVLQAAGIASDTSGFGTFAVEILPAGGSNAIL